MHRIVISADGSWIASGQKAALGMSADIIVWDFKTGSMMHRCIQHKGCISDLSFSSDAGFLASLGGQDDNQLVVWDMKSGAATSGTLAHTGIVHSVSFFRSGSERLVTCGLDHIKVWTLDHTSRKLKAESVALGSLKRTFTSIAITANDGVCYCGSLSGDIVEIDLTSGVRRRTGPAKQTLPLGIKCISIIPQGDLLVGTGEGVVAKLSLTSLRVLSSCKVVGSVTSLSLTPDGTRFFIGTNSSYIYFADTENMKAELRSTCHTNRINAIAFPHNTSEVFATASLSEIKLWNTHNKNELLCIQVPHVECHCIDFAVDGKSIISGWSDGKLRSFTPQTGKLIYAIPDAHKDGVTAVRLFSDCCRVITGGFHGEVRLWKVSRSHQDLTASLKEHKGRVNDVKLRTDDDARAVSASADGSVIIWDLVNKTRLKCLFESTVFTSLVYHPDFSQIITVGSDRKITYWDAFDGEALRVLEGVREGYDINSIAISRSGSHILVSGSDGVVKIYDYDGEELVAVGRGHSTAITCSIVSPNQELVLTGGSDGSVFFWQPSGEFVHKFNDAN